MAEEFGYARFRWNGGSAPWVVRNAIADGMERAAINVQRTMRKRLSVPYPPASKPGESPHKRSGTLKKSITYQLNRQTLQVWIGPDASAEYGVYLEFGTRIMAPRPFLFISLKMEASRITNTMNRAAAIAFKKYAKQRGKR